MDREDRKKQFNQRVLVLSEKRTYGQAYELAEKLEKKKHGDRLFKNYNSYRASKCRSNKYC